MVIRVQVHSYRPVQVTLLLALCCQVGEAQLRDAVSSSRVSYPFSYPTTTTTCVYDGIFTLAGQQGTWTLQSTQAGEYTTKLDEPKDILGILQGRLQGQVVDEILSVKMRTTERSKGRLLHIRDELEVLFRHAGKVRTYSGITKTQQVCDRPAGVVTSSKPIQCRSTTRDQWTVDSVPPAEGNLDDKSTYTVEFVRPEQKRLTTGETIEVDIFRTVWDDGLHVVSYHNTKQPWCPIRVERRRLDEVIGVDTLIKVDVTPPTKIVPREGTLDLVDMALRLLFLGGITIGIAFGVAILASKRPNQGS